MWRVGGRSAAVLAGKKAGDGPVFGHHQFENVHAAIICH